MSHPYGASIFPQHAKLLEESAITPEVARARGYVSRWTRRNGSRDLGFQRYQRSVPGLLIPLHRRGAASVWGYQYRPDEPRVTKAGKTVKYETRAKDQRHGIDVPAAHPRPDSATRQCRCWITEGSRKADAAVSAGLCVRRRCSGVCELARPERRGGRLAVSDWHDVALNGRRVCARVRLAT